VLLEALLGVLTHLGHPEAEQLAKKSCAPELGREYEVEGLGGAVATREHILHVPAKKAVQESVHYHEHNGQAIGHSVVWNGTHPYVLQLEAFALLLIPVGLLDVF
jgi:hypothetical protein